MRVVATGADGFIGSHLVDSLCAEGYQIREFVHYNSFRSWGWLDQVRDSGSCLYGNSCRMDEILRIACRHQLAVAEDATFQGRPTGTFGDFGCFSFSDALVALAQACDRLAEVLG